MNNKLKQIIKEEIEKALQEAELAGTQAASAIAAPGTSNEKAVDDAANTSILRKFAQLPNTQQAIGTLTADFKLLTGDQKHKSLAQFLTSLGIDKQTLQSTISKMQ
jgi:hypothetical protein